jgi:Mg2+ and Co2+ transporter CorA
MHRRDIALRTPLIKRKNELRIPSGKYAQYSSLIPAQYGRFLRQDISASSPLYALSEIFAFAAASESQFLNMIERLVGSVMDSLLNDASSVLADEEPHSSAIANLLYNKRIVEEHIGTLKANVAFLRDGGGYEWPQPSDDKQKEIAAQATTTLYTDFTHLLQQAEKLSDSCDRGIDIAANNAMVVESKRALQQATYVSKLSLLAVLYIPATFTTSLFGMNLVQFGQGSNPNLIWIWACVLVGSYLFTIVLWRFDVAALCMKICHRVLEYMRKLINYDLNIN